MGGGHLPLYADDSAAAGVFTHTLKAGGASILGGTPTGQVRVYINTSYVGKAGHDPKGISITNRKSLTREMEGAAASLGPV